MTTEDLVELHCRGYCDIIVILGIAVFDNCKFDDAADQPEGIGIRLVVMFGAVLNADTTVEVNPKKSNAALGLPPFLRR